MIGRGNKPCQGRGGDGA